MVLSTSQIKSRLEEGGVTPTPVRILVYKSLSESSIPLSLSDLENQLETVDKSTISRTLMTFRNNRLIHSFNDGSGSVKYEICHDINSEGQHHKDMHVHFRCEICNTTYCLTSVKIPAVRLPDGFKISESSYLISGICANCSKE